MTASAVRVGLIGLGAMGTNHLRVLTAMPDAEVAALADLDTPRLKQAGADYRVENIYQTHRELLDSGKIDAVIVAVPPEYHREIACDCAEARIPMLLEKPIAHRNDDARAIVEAVEASQTPCLVGHIERFNPIVRQAKTFVETKKIGSPYLCNTRRSGPFPGRLRGVTHGVLIDLAVHDVDIIQYLAGEKIDHVQAMLIRTKSREIFAKVLYKCGNLLSGSMEFSWISPRKIRDIQFFGTLGMVHGDYIAQTLRFFENPDEAVLRQPWAQTHLAAGRIASGRIIEYPIWRQEPLRLELEHFLRVTRGEAEPEITVQDAAQVMEVVLKINSSGISNPTTMICDT